MQGKYKCRYTESLSVGGGDLTYVKTTQRPLRPAPMETNNGACLLCQRLESCNLQSGRDRLRSSQAAATKKEKQLDK